MATPAEVSLFINKIAPIAVAQAKKHGNKIFPSVCIAQACCESAYGTSPKMKRANAVFGIKVGKSKWHFGKAWKDKAYSTKTKECYDGKTYANITDLFRAYDSIEDAVEDYFDLLCTASRYKAAVNAADYKACIRAIAPSYATAENKDRSYSKSVIKIIETYNLTKYDPTIENTGNEKSLEEIAKEVIDGKWGVGAARKQMLRAAGYNPSIVQAKVNDMLKKKK